MLKKDNVAKPYAFLCVAYFFAAFEGVQEAVVMKAFINMVRTTPSDAASREAVRHAVDIIVPILAERSDAPVENGSNLSLPGDVVNFEGAAQKTADYATTLKLRLWKKVSTAQRC